MDRTRWSSRAAGRREFLSGIIRNATFDLNAPKQLSNIQTIDLAGAPTALNSLTLRNGLDNVTVNIGTPSTSATSNTSFVVHGGNDNAVINVFGSFFTNIFPGSPTETVNLGTTRGQDIVDVNSSTIGATINGGNAASNSILEVYGGGNATMGSKYYATSRTVEITSPATNPTANATNGLDITDYSSGGNTLRAGGPGYMVSIGGRGYLGRLAQGGTTFEVSVASFLERDTIGGFSAPNDLIHLIGRHHSDLLSPGQCRFRHRLRSLASFSWGQRRSPCSASSSRPDSIRRWTRTAASTSPTRKRGACAAGFGCFRSPIAGQRRGHRLRERPYNRSAREAWAEATVADLVGSQPGARRRSEPALGRAACAYGRQYRAVIGVALAMPAALPISPTWRRCPIRAAHELDPSPFVMGLRPRCRGERMPSARQPLGEGARRLRPTPTRRR